MVTSNLGHIFISKPDEKNAFSKRKDHTIQQLLFKILKNTLFHRIHTGYSVSLLLSIFTVKYF